MLIKSDKTCAKTVRIIVEKERSEKIEINILVRWITIILFFRFSFYVYAHSPEKLINQAFASLIL
jgi:hypothetical protein